MNGLLFMILTMSLAGSLLAAIMLIGERLWGRRMRYVWQYYLWLIVIARLLIPGGLPAAAPEVPSETAVAAVQETLTESAGTAESPPGSAPAAPAYADWLAAVEGRSPQSWPQALLSALTIVWLGGAVVLAVHRITAYRGFLRCLRAGMEPCGDADLLNLAGALADRLHIQQPVEICVNPLAASPMLIGWRKPCIVFPEMPGTRAEFECAVLHELVHWKRKDHLYKWLVQAAVWVHWFNPLVHYLSKRIARLCELACDERVMQLLGRREASTYGGTLLNSMGGAHSCRAAAGTLELSESTRLLKERLERMNEHTQRKPVGTYLALLLSACLIVCAACARVYTPYGPGQRNRSAEHSSQTSGAAGTTGAWAAGNAQLVISAERAWIDVQSAGGSDVVSTDFDADFYTVDVREENGKTTVSCRSNVRDPRSRKVTIYVPEQGIEIVETTLQESLQTGQAPAAQQMFRVDRSCLQLQMPETPAEYSVTAAQSLLCLESESGFAASEIEMQMAQTLLIADDPINTRLKREGEYAVLPASDPQSHIYVEAAEGLVLLNTGQAGSLSDLLEMWADLPEASTDETHVPVSGAVGAVVSSALHEAAQTASESIRESTGSGAARPDETSSRQSGAVRGILGAVADGVGDILSEVGSGVGDMLEGISQEVRDGIAAG